MLTKNININHQGYPRSAYMRVADNAKFAIVLLHPTAGTGRISASTGGWTAREDISILAPDGLSFDPSSERTTVNTTCWSSEQESTINRAIDDVSFLNEVVDEFLTYIPKDIPLILVGHSNGCAMGFKLLVEGKHKDLFKAAVLYAAPWASKKEKLNIPVLYMTGDSDPIRPLSGGVKVETPWFTLISTPVMDTVEYCLKALDCNKNADDVVEQDHFTVMTWRGRQLFEFVILKNQGHHWPAGKDISEKAKEVVGPVNCNINATTMAIEFLNKAGVFQL